MRKTRPIDLEEVAWIHEHYVYDETSYTCLRWKKDTGYKGHKGSVAGFLNICDYYYSRTGKRVVSVARIVWILHGHPELPPHLTLDHIDRDRHDNRIANLRPATGAQQRANRTTRRQRNVPFVGT